MTFSPTTTGSKSATLAITGISTTGGPSSTALTGDTGTSVNEWMILDNE